MSEASEYRDYGDKALILALETEDAAALSYLMGLAARWHMMAARLEAGAAPEVDDLYILHRRIPLGPEPTAHLT